MLIFGAVGIRILCAGKCGVQRERFRLRGRGNLLSLLQLVALSFPPPPAAAAPPASAAAAASAAEGP